MKLDVRFRSDDQRPPRGQFFLYIAAAIQMIRRNDRDLDHSVIAALLRPPIASKTKLLPPGKAAADE